MKELTQHEILSVSGAGIIENALGSVGGFIGNGLYGLVSDSLGIDLPFIGNVNLGNVLPDLGKDVGSMLGSLAGSSVENVIGSIPFVGGWLNGLLGN